jgi:hypothetical protein
MKSLRIAICVSSIVATFMIGFVVWYWLFGVLFGGMAAVGLVICCPPLAYDLLRKKRPSELTLSIVICVGVSAVAFAGWYTRGILREDAMIAESVRLVERAEAFRKQEGRVPHSARTIPPRTSDEHFIAWIAGTSVRYGGYDNGRFCVARGEAIAGEVYWSDRGKWEVAKL